MQTNQLTKEEIILKSKELANSINHSSESFTELTADFLTKNNKEEIGSNALAYKSLVIDLFALLSNPNISSLLEKRSADEMGPFLKNLFNYLDLVEMEHEQIQKYYDFIRLSKYSGGITENDLNYYIQEYSN